MLQRNVIASLEGLCTACYLSRLCTACYLCFVSFFCIESYIESLVRHRNSYIEEKNRWFGPRCLLAVKRFAQRFESHAPEQHQHLSIYIYMERERERERDRERERERERERGLRKDARVTTPAP
jgi:hypothetical protein